MSIHLNSADLSSQASIKIRLDEKQSKKMTDLQNCIGLMEDFGVKPILARFLNSTPQAMLLTINSYEDERSETKKANLRTLIVAGITAISLPIIFITKTNTKIEEIYRLVAIAVSSCITSLAIFSFVEGLLKVGMIKEYVEACKSYIQEYYPDLVYQIEKSEGKARVKK
jgi:hypothetical protein